MVMLTWIFALPLDSIGSNGSKELPITQIEQCVPEIGPCVIHAGLPGNCTALRFVAKSGITGRIFQKGKKLLYLNGMNTYSDISIK